jgi:hypothetical protein
MKVLDSGQFGSIAALFGSEKNKAILDSKNTMLQLQDMANQEARGKALQELMASLGVGGSSGGGSGGGGGGGGRYGGGGGSGSSGNFYASDSETSTETNDRKNVLIGDLINSLWATDPELADWVQEQWASGGNETGAVLKYAYGQRDALERILAKPDQNISFNKLPNAYRWGSSGGLAGRTSYKVPAAKPTGWGSTLEQWNWLIQNIAAGDDTLGLNTSQSFDQKTTQTNKRPVPTTVAQNRSISSALKPPNSNKPNTPNSNKPKAPKPTLGAWGGSGWGRSRR